MTDDLWARRGSRRAVCGSAMRGPGWTMARTATALGVSERTIARVKPRFVEERLAATRQRKPRATPPARRV